ncbi:ribonuclease III [Daldinia caldariorum]|uniref:ribonuclease III n=1 Tax=Daldinia caldariorum TaxID=326644 RepID=UPI0020088359|nr:ribonuclease III [Daldinia caldariorum]KAI1472036.1 ribonuclease III [Daldinia caldariorum]
MSKRLFANVESNDSSQNATSISEILKHAEDLLKSAKALNEELQQFRDVPSTNDAIASVLKCHNKKILPVAQLLEQDEKNALGQDSPRPSKARKLGDEKDSKTSLEVEKIPMPNPVSLTRWTPDDIPSSGLPPLPAIVNPAFERAALTHQGMATDQNMSYERLEWVGDAYLYLMSTAFIFQTFPNLSVGRCAQLRERLVRNETLLNYTIKYGIDKRAVFPAEFGAPQKPEARQGASEAARKKALGDLFESYVAAIILADSDNLSRVSSWMKSLWSTELAHEIQAEFRSKLSSRQGDLNGKVDKDGDNRSAKQDLPPKVLLNTAIVVSGVKLSYNDVGEPKKDKHLGLPLHTVGVFLNGWGESNLQLGIGSALSKKEAGNNAARAALDNKKLIERFRQKKQEYLIAREKSLAEPGAQQEYDNWS